MGMKTIKCKECDKEFKSYNSLQRKFCSTKCYYENQKGKERPDKKTGSIKKCIVCGKEIYVSKSLLGQKKYCSNECGHKDKWGFKPKEKICVVCGNKFTITSALETNNLTCSFECRRSENLRRSKLQREKNRKIVVIRKCRYCGNDVITNKYCPSNFCGGNKGECYKKHLSETRQGKNNPAYRNGTRTNGTTQTGKHMYACKKYKRKFLEKHDYLFCENCGTNINGTMRFETHHLYFASKYPKHKELHNPKNLIILCIQCHNDFHSSKREKEFKKIEKERGLKKLFKI